MRRAMAVAHISRRCLLLRVPSRCSSLAAVPPAFASGHLSGRPPASTPASSSSIPLDVAGPRPRRLASTAGEPSAEAASEPEPEPLMCRADQDVARLGGTIAAQAREHGRVAIRSVGPRAAYRAVKAVVNASEYLQQDDGTPEDRWLAFTVSSEVSMIPRGGDSEEKPRAVLVLEARPRPFPRASPKARDLIVSGKTNAGKAAAAMASAMRPGVGSQAAVRAMGAQAVYQALTAAATAQAYLDNDGRGVRFVVLPNFEEMQNSDPNLKAKQLVLWMVSVSE